MRSSWPERRSSAGGTITARNTCNFSMSFTDLRAAPPEGQRPRLPRRRTLLWKYAAYSAALVAAVLVAVGAVTGYFAYRDAEAAQGVLLREKAGGVAIHIASFFWG